MPHQPKLDIGLTRNTLYQCCRAHRCTWADMCGFLGTPHEEPQFRPKVCRERAYHPPRKVYDVPVKQHN